MKHLICLLFLGLFAFSYGSSDDIPDLQNKLLVDEINFLPQAEQQTIASFLNRLAVETSNQFVLFISDDFRGYDKAEFAFEIGNKNGVGNKEFENGLVIVLKPKTARTKGEVFIATGYGLEGIIPDAIANRIIDKEMIPRFKQNDYYGGITAALNVLSELARGEYSYKDYQRKTKKSNGFVAIFIFMVIVFILFSRLGGARKYARNNNLPFWIALSLLNSSGRSQSGGFSDFSSGSGGFGGFGGGGFGGGGAGGSW